MGLGAAVSVDSRGVGTVSGWRRSSTGVVRTVGSGAGTAVPPPVTAGGALPAAATGASPTAFASALEPAGTVAATMVSPAA